MKANGVKVPLGHIGRSEDVVNAVVFLSSESSRYITGTKLVVDGAIRSTRRTDFKMKRYVIMPYSNSTGDTRSVILSRFYLLATMNME